MPDDIPSGNRSLSLLFTYTGPTISLVDEQPVDAPWLASEDTGPLSGEPGFWYELRDTNDAVVWRHSAVHPLWFESEGPANEAGEMTWRPDPAPSGGFAAQVPLLDVATRLALVGSPPLGADPGPVADLAVFELGGIV